MPHSDEEQDGSACRGSGTAPGRARDRPETGMRTEAGREGWNRARGRNGGWNWDGNWQHTQKKEEPPQLMFAAEAPSKKAATYSPALRCSTIGAPGLNFSVRDGKRWNTGAKAT